MLHPYQKHFPILAPDVFVAPGAHVIGQVEIGAEASIWFNSVVRGDVGRISIGPKTNIQDNSTLHVTGGKFDTWIGAEVTVGHRVILHGCRVEARALIGMGAVILDGAEIGGESIVGAGSLVSPGTKIPPRVLALGSPCRVRRGLTPEEISGLLQSAEHYAELARIYSKNPLS